MKNQIMVREYYTTEGKKVYLHRAIGDGEFEKILTPYKEVPYQIVKWLSEEEIKELTRQK